MFKYSVILLVFMAIIQYGYGKNNQYGDTKDDLEKAFHELMDLVDAALTTAEDTLNAALQVVKDEASELEADANSQLDEILDPLRTKLNDLIQKAKDLGIDVTKCQSYVDDFDNIPDKLVTDLGGCITTQVEKAEKYVTDAIDNIKKIEQDLNSIDTEIDDCSGNIFEEVECYAKLAIKIADDTVQVPAKIAADVAAAKALVVGIVPILEACLTGKVSDAGTQAAKDVADFAVCAALD